jgi:hypothetical protein
MMHLRPGDVAMVEIRVAGGMRHLLGRCAQSGDTLLNVAKLGLDASNPDMERRWVRPNPMGPESHGIS